jgi:hypothetical protein
MVKAGQSEDCRVEEKLAKYRHAPQLVQRTSGHATNLSMSKFNGFWSRPGESEFQLLIFFSKCKSRGSRYRVFGLGLQRNCVSDLERLE